jgi:hypothetical protein
VHVPAPKLAVQPAKDAFVMARPSPAAPPGRSSVVNDADVQVMVLNVMAPVSVAEPLPLNTSLAPPLTVTVACATADAAPTDSAASATASSDAILLANLIVPPEARPGARGPRWMSSLLPKQPAASPTREPAKVGGLRAAAAPEALLERLWRSPFPIASAGVAGLAPYPGEQPPTIANSKDPLLRSDEPTRGG